MDRAGRCCRPPGQARRLDEAWRLGLRPGQDRSTAWFQLAAELPARLLAACPASTSRSRAPGRTSVPGPGQLCRRRQPLSGTLTRCQDCANPAWPAPAAGADSAFPGMPATGSRVECDVGPRHLMNVECWPPWRQGAGSEWTRFPDFTRLRYTGPPGPGRFTGATVTCASPAMTSSSHHRASATCCARSTATRSRSSGDRPVQAEASTQCRYLTVPLPPGPARHPVP